MDSFLEQEIPQEISRDDLHLTTAALWTTRWIFSWLWTIPHHTSQALWQGCVLSPRFFCAVLEFALETGGMPLDRLASIWCMGPPHFVWRPLCRWHCEFWWFLPAHVTNSRNWPIHWWYGNTFGANRFAVRCGEDRGANQSCATTSNSCNGWAAAAHNLGAGGCCCMLTAAGSQSQHIYLEYHLWSIIFLGQANCKILLDRSVSVFERFKYLNAVVSSVAFLGRGHGATYILWMFMFKKFACQSLDRRRRLTGMRPGTRFFTCTNTWFFITCHNCWNLYYVMLIFFVPAPFSCNHLWFKQTFLAAAKRNMILPNWTWNMVDYSG